MLSVQVSRRWRHAATGFFVMLGLLIASLPGTATARVVSCKKDPIVYLSNGKTVKIVETIYTSAANVARIDYTVRVPGGVTMTKVVFTGGASISAEEYIRIEPTHQPTLYTTTVRVTLKDAATNVPVVGQTTIGKSTAKFSGNVAQDLIANLSVK
jgi:hypothetical protein